MARFTARDVERLLGDAGIIRNRLKVQAVVFLAGFLPLQAKPLSGGRQDPAKIENPKAETTKVVLLGTGNPNPDPRHSGCSVLILVGDTPYIVDFGPGLIRQAAALTSTYGGPLTGLKI